MSLFNAVEQLRPALAIQCGRRRLFVLPSTTETHAAVDDWCTARPGLAVVAPRWGRSVAAFLEALGLSSAPETVVVFSDQLTSGVDAPLRVRRAGQDEFLPTIEALAARNFGYEILAWTGDGFTAAENTNPCNVLRLLLTYREACTRLGSEWLARDSQAERLPERRYAEARHRLRLLQSALMAGAGHDADGILTDTCRRAVTRLERLHRAAGAQGAQ